MALRTNNPFLPGLVAFRKNLRSILVLQVALILLVVGYFFVPAVKVAAKFASDWKDHASLPMLFAAGMVAGGLLPELAKLLSGQIRLNREWLPSTAYNSGVYGSVALITNTFYTAMNVWPGPSTGPGTVLVKTLIDMFLMTPLVFSPFTVLMFEAYSLKFSPTKMWASLKDRFYVRRIVPSLAMAWGYWVPVLCAMYALPLSLQFPVAMVAEAAWSILIVYVNVQERAELSATA